MDKDLNTSTTGGSLSSTSTPQSSGASNLSSTAGNLQSINADSLLNNNTGSGISLNPANLSTVDVNKTSSLSYTPKHAISTKHHVSAGLVIVIIVLLVLAAGLFFRNISSENNTTY